MHLYNEKVNLKAREIIFGWIWKKKMEFCIFVWKCKMSKTMMQFCFPLQLFKFLENSFCLNNIWFESSGSSSKNAIKLFGKFAFICTKCVLESFPPYRYDPYQVSNKLQKLKCQIKIVYVSAKTSTIQKVAFCPPKL